MQPTETGGTGPLSGLDEDGMEIGAGTPNQALYRTDSGLVDTDGDGMPDGNASLVQEQEFKVTVRFHSDSA